VIEEGRPGREGIRRTHVDDPHPVDPRPLWFDPEQARGLTLSQGFAVAELISISAAFQPGREAVL
jgi:hypothetical protein